MSTRSTLSWQMMLADLSLILFMVTAAAMAAPDGKAVAAHSPAQPAAPPAAPPAALADPARAEPVAVWREGPGGLPLARWLAGQQADPRQQLTLTLRYGPGGQAQAMAHGAALTGEAATAGGAGRDARVLIEPAGAGAGAGAYAVLAYDRASQQPVR